MARLIKKGSTDLGDISPETGFAERTSGGGKVIRGEKFDAKSEAQEIRNRAQASAQHIIEQAHQEAEQIRQNAYAEAKEQGYREGREAGASELSEIIAGTSKRMQQIERQAVPQLKELALKIARKIIGKELEFHPDAVVDIVKQALSEKARLRREIYLRVNPDDLQAIRQSKADLVEVLSRCKEIGIREDENVSRHGVIIETDAGTIDAQLETQLAVFERILKELD